jgi:hypothetical protein
LNAWNRPHFGWANFDKAGAIPNLKYPYFVLICSLALSLLVSVSFCIAQEPQVVDPPEAASVSALAADQTPEPGSTTPPGASAGQSPNGQTSNGQTDAQSSDKDKKSSSGQTPGTTSDTTTGTSKDRLFFALPNFLTVDANGKIIPLTTGQKFKVVAQGSFDPVQIVWYAALSGISQAENSEPGYGQGAVGYGKRYGAYAADGIIENFFVGAIFPSIFHQDPRFFPKPQGSFFSRAIYAASRIVITRSDSGKREFNFSEVFGAAMASAISTNSYHPRRTFRGYDAMGVPEYYPSDRTLTNTASVWGSQMGYDAITLVVKEFWPDIRRKVKK